MASSKLVVVSMGLFGVNVDRDPIELNDNELTQAQNAIQATTSGDSSLRKRPGFNAFNTSAISAGTVLGGSDVPLRNTSTSGIRSLYIGRGPLS